MIQLPITIEISDNELAELAILGALRKLGLQGGHDCKCSIKAKQDEDGKSKFWAVVTVIKKSV